MAGADFRIRIIADSSQAEQALRRVGTSVRQAGTEVDDSMRHSTAAVSNLSAQFMDIGVMMQAGQNPLTLAVQQGSQISQVLGPMGAAGAVRALGAGLMTLINPMTAITIGTIAGGAMLVNWLTNSGEAAEGASDAIDDLKAATDRSTAATVNASAGADTLIRKYGAWADAAREALRAEDELAAREQGQQADTTVQTVQDLLGVNVAGRSEEDIRTAIRLTQELAAARAEADAQTGEGVDLDAQANIQSILDQIATLDGLDRELEGLAATMGQSSVAAVERLASAMVALDEADTTEERVTALEELKEAFNAAVPVGKILGDQGAVIARTLNDAYLAELDMASADIAGPIEAAVGPAQRLAAALNDGRGSQRQIVQDAASLNTERFFDRQEAIGEGILPLIRSVEGTAGPNGYNTSLRNGAYLPGGQEQDLVNKSLNEIRELQRYMLANPANTENSSALGAYQIVGQTLERLIQKLDLDRSQAYSPELQDRLALELVRERMPQGLAGFQNEWEGIRDQKISAAQLQTALGASPVPTVDPVVQQETDAFINQAGQAIDRGDAAAKREAEAELERAQREADRIRQRNFSEAEALAHKRTELAALVSSEALTQEEANDELARYTKELHDNNEEVKRAEALLKSLETPLETYNRKVAEATELQQAGRISQLQLNAAVAEAGQEYTAAMQAQSEDARAANEDATTRAQARLEASIGAGRDLVGGWISDIRSGITLLDMLGNTAGKVADRLISMGLDSLFGTAQAPGPWAGLGSALFGGLGAAPAPGPSFIGPMPLDGMRAGGGRVWAGGRFRVNEGGSAMPEVFIPDRGGYIATAAQMSSPENAARAAASQGPIQMEVTSVIDPEGNIVPVITRVSGAQVRASEARQAKMLPARVNKISSDPRGRGRL